MINYNLIMVIDKEEQSACFINHILIFFSFLFQIVVIRCPSSMARILFGWHTQALKVRWIWFSIVFSCKNWLRLWWDTILTAIWIKSMTTRTPAYRTSTRRKRAKLSITLVEIFSFIAKYYVGIRWTEIKILFKYFF